MGFSDDQIHDILELKEQLTEEIEKHLEEIEKLEKNISILNTILKQSSFTKASDLTLNTEKKKDAVPIIKNSVVVVLSYDWEGLPTILIEALSLKKQIVSTDCPSGPREILDHGKYGLLVPVNNPEKLAEGIAQIIKGKVKFDEELLLQRAKYFNIEKSFNQFMEVIN